MQYIIRCISDTDEDVIRDFYISGEADLLALHQCVISFFGLVEGEMASFYKTDNDWIQGEEIPLYNMSEQPVKEMKDISISEVLTQEENKLIYVYDYLNMWTFYIELMKVDMLQEQKDPQLIKSIGTLPMNPPEKYFTSDEINDDVDFDEEKLDIDEDFDIDSDLY